MNGYALGDALLGGRETDEWWQREVTRIVEGLAERGIKVSHQVEEMARSDRHGFAAVMLMRRHAREVKEKP